MKSKYRIPFKEQVKPTFLTRPGRCVYDYTLSRQQGTYLDGNARKVHSEVGEGGRLDSNLLSEASKRAP
jgi:hypothetical protein